MPHQQYIADVLGEIDNDSGELAYSEGGVTIPRQEGKSTFVLAKSTHRANATEFFGPRQRLIYTAQNRLKAREKWEEDFLPELEASEFGLRMKPYRGMGIEHLRWVNGSRFGLEAATERAGHGLVIDEAYLDEAFAHQDWRLEQAFGPAMITRRNKLLLWISTAGWLGGSPYLEAKVELGRQLAAAGVRSGTAYFEWSAPQDADPGDPVVWRSCMPALGLTISEAAIRAEYEKACAAGKLNEFRRAYLNQWVPKDQPDEWTLISEPAWLGLTDARSEPSGAVAFAVVFESHRNFASVGVAGRRADGRWHVELAAYQAGTAWVVPWVVERVERHRPVAVVVDPGGHEGSVIAALEQARVEVTKPTARDVCAAFGTFMEVATDSRTLRHRNQVELNRAVAGAVPRDVGDAGRAWGRRKSGTDISPVVACTSALWGFMMRAPLVDVVPGAWSG
jgi:hypothetical protein